MVFQFFSHTGHTDRHIWTATGHNDNTSSHGSLKGLGLYDKACMMRQCQPTTESSVIVWLLATKCDLTMHFWLNNTNCLLVTLIIKMYITQHYNFQTFVIVSFTLLYIFAYLVSASTMSAACFLLIKCKKTAVL